MRYAERQMTSERLDQPRKSFIRSTQHSGGYRICRYMINPDLGAPHEYINPIVVRRIASRSGLGAAIEGLRRRQRNGSHAIEKLQSTSAIKPSQPRNSVMASKPTVAT
jgi:hypothetical protein